MGKIDKNKLLDRIEKEPEFVENIDEKLKKDVSFIFEAIKRNPDSHIYFPTRSRNNETILRYLMKEHGEFYLLEYAKENIKNDPEIMLLAIKKDGKYFKYASEELKNNKEFVMKALELSEGIYKHINDEFKKDTSVLLKAVEKDKSALYYADDSLKMDRDLAFEILKKGGIISRYHGDDREVMLEAVKVDGWNLRMASDRLKNDEEVVKLALKQKPSSLEYAGEQFKENVDLAAEVVKREPMLLSRGLTRMRNNFKVAFNAVISDGDIFACISPKLRNDPEFVLTVMKERPELYEHEHFKTFSTLANNPILDRYSKLDESERIEQFDTVKEEIIKSLKKHRKI